MDSDKSILETEEEQDGSIPSGVSRFVIRNIGPSADRSCSFGLNGLDPEQMSEQQRMKTFLGCHRHLECCFDNELV